MRPAARSTFDILFWFQEQARLSGRSQDFSFLQKQLYFSQAVFSFLKNGRKLMPATFLATDVGPVEPDVFTALDQGLTLSSAVPPSQEVQEVLQFVWKICAEKTVSELELILSQDPALRAAKSRGRNSEIDLKEMAAAYGKSWPALGNVEAFNSFPDGTKFAASKSTLEAAPPAKQEVRFTADGRSVTKWMPRKRIPSVQANSGS